MPRSYKKVSEKIPEEADVIDNYSHPPAITPEDREDQLISLAVDLAEKKLRDGTASNALINYWLMRGSTRERLEKEKLEKENELLKAKTESIKSAKRIDEMYAAAIRAMKLYQGPSDEDDEYEQADI